MLSSFCRGSGELVGPSSGLQVDGHGFRGWTPHPNWGHRWQGEVPEGTECQFSLFFPPWSFSPISGCTLGPVSMSLLAGF